MADFRKWILALTVLALVFTGVATAQGVNENPLNCQAGTGQPPQLRTEGYTELVGDITITCTGGTLPGAPGTLIQPTNVVINLQGTVTSRLLGATTTVGTPSEALLILDEPGNTTLGGIGPTLPQYLCNTPLTGCPGYVGTVTSGGITATYPVAAPTSNQAAPNVYQGVSNGTAVTFYGVPILAPVSTGVSRIIRITNVRVNANGITGGGTGFQSVLAQISTNNSGVVVSNPTVTVGYIQQSLLPSFRNATNTGNITTVNEYQCQPQTNTLVGILRFSELFGTAFKTRVNAFVNGVGAVYPATVDGYGTATTIQNIPGAVYSSESGFISAFSGGPTPGPLVNTVGGVTYTAGLADYGTRLKAVFSNIPTGVSVYVSTVNLIGTVGNALLSSPSTTGINAASGTSPEYAFLVNTETGIDPQTPVTSTLAGTAPGENPEPGLFQIVPGASGSAEVVWEVVQELPNTSENFDFGVYISFPSNITPSSQGISAVLSYAPTPTVPFSATQGGQASTSLTIPRFAVATTSSGTPFLNINQCTTALLFPYITTAFLVAGQSGFDTGISIANTTSDPFGTANQAGLCTLYWYGGPPGATTAATNPNPTTLGAGGVGSSVPILTGTTALTLASQSVPANWSGYMIALCNFQYAHGYASVTDVGVRNIMASYLALVITDRTYGGCYGAISTPGSCAGVENLNN